MGKVLAILGGVFFVLLLMCGGGLYFAMRAGSAVQEEFFTAVNADTPDQLLGMMSPELLEEVDPHALDAWMKQVHKTLGKYEGMDISGFNTSVKIVNGTKRTESKGVVNFEHGKADSSLVFENDKLVSFSVRSDKIGDDWFTGPTDSSLYKAHSEIFIRAFLDGNVASAYDQAHKSLKDKISKDELQTLMENVSKAAGPLTSLAYDRETFDHAKGDQLLIYYQVVCEKEKLVAEITFNFIGMRAYMTGFNFQSAANAENPPKE